MVLCYNKKSVDPEAGFVGRHRALTPMNEFFLTLCHLRLALKEQDLAYRFPNFTVDRFPYYHNLVELHVLQVQRSSNLAKSSSNRPFYA